MLSKILLGIILTLFLACGSLYLMLDSKSNSLKVSEGKVASLTISLEKAQSLRKKHEEIIAELFLDQDTTQEQFDDLEVKFNRLKGSSCKPQSTQRTNINVKEDVVVKLDLSEHKRLLSEAACLAGNGSACPSTAPPE